MNRDAERPFRSAIPRDAAMTKTIDATKSSASFWLAKGRGSAGSSGDCRDGRAGPLRRDAPVLGKNEQIRHSWSSAKVCPGKAVKNGCGSEGSEGSDFLSRLKMNY